MTLLSMTHGPVCAEEVLQSTALGQRKRSTGATDGIPVLGAEGERPFMRTKLRKAFVCQKADENRRIMERVFEEAAIRQGDIDGLLDAKGLAQGVNFSSLLLLLGKVET